MFIQNYISLKKFQYKYSQIGNPNKDTGSVSMHLYAPPYNICKVWSSVSSLLSEFELSKIGYFSVFGLR